MTTHPASYQRPIPFVRIVHQPSPIYRMRYKAENRNALLYSEEYIAKYGFTQPPRSSNSQISDDLVKFPRIEIINGQGPATLIVTCVSKCEPYHVHPHKLVGEKCKSGVGVFTIGPGEKIFDLTGLAIEFTKQKDFAETFQELKQKNVDPFNAGYNFDHSKIDLTQLRLCFQVFLRDSLETSEIVRDAYHILRPIVSNIISNSSRKSSLQIIRASGLCSPASGGGMVSLHLKKLEADQRPLMVRFHDEHGWSVHFQIADTDIHYRCSLMFPAPQYKSTSITEPKTVSLCLCVPFKNEKDKKEFLTKQKKDENNNNHQDESEEINEDKSSDSEADSVGSTPTVDTNDMKYMTKVMDFVYTPCDVNIFKRKLDVALFYDFQDQAERDAVNDVSQESRKSLAKRQFELVSSNNGLISQTKLSHFLIDTNQTGPVSLNHSIKHAQELGLFVLNDNENKNNESLEQDYETDSIENQINDLNQLKLKLDNYINDERNSIPAAGLANTINLEFDNCSSLGEIITNNAETINFDDIFST